MSDTTNGSVPDSAAQRGEVVGGALHEDARNEEGRTPVSAEPVQDEPVLEQNDASTSDKLDGIAAQTRVDLGEESHERYEEVLRQRLSDAGISQTDDEVTALARRSHPGSGGGGV
ncbi:hypothetical protein [uncultured Microbacterium sp.]|uniref:hypothetical protein n=1 Tax=uncultured Microbacterium sp. TaxID=191216 RepID=UPI0028D22F43|nr:hypothetical protein [uncultured Microbacterium sp.]